MKRLIILFAIMLGLGGAAYFINASKTSTKTTAPDRNFAFPAEDMGKIILTKPSGEVQTFTWTEGGTWYLNDRYKVSQFTMPYLTHTMADIEIQNIPPKASTKNLIDEIEKVGIGIQIFDKSGKKVRSYRVGTESYERNGTIFLMDGYDQPYNMYIRGFDGNLRSRFMQRIDKWRDKQIFGIEKENIASVVVDYPKSQASSFKITKDGNSYDVSPTSQFLKKSTKELNINKIENYLAEYVSVFGEEFDTDNARRDSIVNLIPFATVTVETTSGKKKELDLFPFRDLVLKNVNSKSTDDVAEIERYFAYIKDTKDFMVAQNKLIMPLLRPYDYFLKEE